MGIIVEVEPVSRELRYPVGNVWERKRHGATPCNELPVQRMKNVFSLVPFQRRWKVVCVDFSSDFAGNLSQGKDMEWHGQEGGFKRIWNLNAIDSNAFFVNSSKVLT